MSFKIICLATLLFDAAAALLTASASEQTSPMGIWYPFLKSNKWGFIDSQGTWKIQPAYGAVYNVFDKDLVRVWSDGKWGYIDRTGSWIVKPQFDEPLLDFNENGYQVVFEHKKQGILDRAGHLLLPAKYSEVVLSSDRAWVRISEHLGVFGFDGKWINKMETVWPKNFETPMSLNSSGVAWFQDGPGEGKWGLINAKGQIVFPPQFDAHIMGRHETDDWDRPDGLDFENGQAHVYKDGKPLLISVDGKTQHDQVQDFVSKEPWSPDLTLVHTMKDDELRTKDGKTLFSAAGGIGKPHEGMAIFTVLNPHGVGVIDSKARVVVPAGTYFELNDFHGGLAAAARKGGNLGFPNDRSAGFLDSNGHEIIPFSYWATSSFSDGLAAVTAVLRNEKAEATGLASGYIDITGKMVVAPQYDQGVFTTTPFSRNRAWVLKVGDKLTGLYGLSPNYALIDATGKVLTDFRFEPPEKDKEYIHSADQPLEQLRWRGNLVLLAHSFNLGLATADGKILFEPQFREIEEVHDGMILASSRGDQGNTIRYLTEQGEMLPDAYSAGSDFVKGSAWVCKSLRDDKGVNHEEGFTLIDHQGKALLPGLYKEPQFVIDTRLVHDDAPGAIRGGSEAGHGVFIGDLACIASVTGFSLTGRDRSQHMDWGYTDHTGHIIAWHYADPK